VLISVTCAQAELKLKNFMFHFTQFRPESIRQRRLHQNPERHERCPRQEDVCYLESVFFPKLCCCAFPLCAFKVVASQLHFFRKIFFFGPVSIGR